MENFEIGDIVKFTGASNESPAYEIIGIDKRNRKGDRERVTYMLQRLNSNGEIRDQIEKHSFVRHIEPNPPFRSQVSHKLARDKQLLQAIEILIEDFA